MHSVDGGDPAMRKDRLKYPSPWIAVIAIGVSLAAVAHATSHDRQDKRIDGLTAAFEKMDTILTMQSEINDRLGRIEDRLGTAPSGS